MTRSVQERFAGDSRSGGGGTAPTHHRLNQAAIAAAMAAPAGERTSKLFQHIVMVGEAKVA
ncbi:hypothetical protein BRX36_11270 [Sphingomonas sp. S-NIH.Pt1_0416]|nr:hypothetical protein BRX36_11270 [Sphingomonas sp. S-NIH.Pt1_0416]